jgi:hypothetical protein
MMRDFEWVMGFLNWAVLGGLDVVIVVVCWFRVAKY